MLFTEFFTVRWHMLSILQNNVIDWSYCLYKPAQSLVVLAGAVWISETPNYLCVCPCTVDIISAKAVIFMLAVQSSIH